MPDERPEGRVRYAALLAIVALAVAVRWAWIEHVYVNPLDGRFDDTVFYYSAAKSLAQDFTYRDNFGNYSAHWPPGYPLALGAVFTVTGTHLAVAKALNVAFAAATVVLTYAVGARAFGVRTGLVAALLLALAPGHVFFTPLAMTEVMFCFGFLAVVAMLIWWTIDVAPASWWWWFPDQGGPEVASPRFSANQEPRMLALGLVTGYLALVRAEAVFLPAVFMFLWLVVLPRWRPLLWHAAIFGAGFVLAITPWTVRNAIRFHELVPLRANSQGTLSNAFDPSYPHRLDQFRSPPLGETAGRMALHPWRLVPLEATKLRYLYRDDSDGIEWVRYWLTASDARRWSRMADWYLFAVGLAALASAPLLWRRRDPRRVVLAYMLVAWTAVLIIAWPQTRYHMPVVPILCMFAGWTFVSSYNAVVAGLTAAATRIDFARVPAPWRRSPPEAGISPDERTGGEQWTDPAPDALAPGGQPGPIDAEGRDERLEE